AISLVGIFPGKRNEDDISIREEDKPLATFYFLRQQKRKEKEQVYYSLADFFMPASYNKQDYLGMFAVSAGFGIEEFAASFEKKHDDYNSILVKALGDRLAEGLAEYTHEKVRKEIWGYSPDENFSNEDLIREKYRGIRPAPGYPACPDHTEKRTIFRILQAEKYGISLTENCAMLPAGSVSGLYFSHPDSKYFAVGKIGKDQVESYASRKGWDLKTAERWLRPNLAYSESQQNDEIR
ncbi:MAG: methionine synthase, partial [Candidatus Hydrogenedentota bacterium]